jgi:hypothetical protein
MERRKWNFTVDAHAYCPPFYCGPANKCSITDWLPRCQGNAVNTTFCGPAHGTLLSNRKTEKFNFATNYITTIFVYFCCRIILRMINIKNWWTEKIYGTPSEARIPSFLRYIQSVAFLKLYQFLKKLLYVLGIMICCKLYTTQDGYIR